MQTVARLLANVGYLPQKVQTLTFRARVGGRRRRRGEPQKVQTVARLLVNVGYLPQKVQTLTFRWGTSEGADGGASVYARALCVPKRARTSAVRYAIFVLQLN